MDLITYDINSKCRKVILTEEQKLYIINHCKIMTNRELASVLKVPEQSIKFFIYHKKLHPTTSKPYTREEKVFISDNYRTLSYKEIATILNRTSDSVRKKTKDLGLRRSPEDSIYLQKKYCCKTYFPKDHKPGNTLYNGAVTIRNDKRGVPHKFIRIGEGKWAELQIHTWEQKYGPVPSDMVLKCIDGDTLNCDLSNWRLMSKVELLERNSGRKELTDKYIADILSRDDKKSYELIRSMPDLIEAKRSELKLRRTINGQDGFNTATSPLNDREEIPVQRQECII